MSGMPFSATCSIDKSNSPGLLNLISDPQLSAGSDCFCAPRRTRFGQPPPDPRSPEVAPTVSDGCTDDLTLDETMAVSDRDVVLVPKGYHPVGAPHGFDLYYLNVMAGPVRSRKFIMAPDHAHLIYK